MSEQNDFLIGSTERGRVCQHCMETDHASQACALAPTIVGETGQGQGFSREYDDQRKGRPGIERRYGEPVLTGMRGSAISPTVALSTYVQSVGATIGSSSAEVQP